MRIGILSFHASHNFGSMLQNYALQSFLRAEGYDVETINLRNSRQRYMYNYPLRIGRTSPTIWKMLCRLRDPKWLIAEFRRWHIFESFLSDKLILSNEYEDWDGIKKDLLDEGKDYDAIIVGGDQIWNPFCFDFDWSYYLPDEIGRIKKISFSPSFGDSIPKLKTNVALTSRIKAYLGSFNSLSVREKDASDYLQGLLNRDVPVVSDPTLLLTPSDYLKLTGAPIVREPYIYYYTPCYSSDNEAEEIAAKLSEEKGLRLVMSYPRYGKKTNGKSVLSGPAEFLNLVKNAQIVVGKSYHLVIFSILFHKDFITLKFGDDARVNNLLNTLKIGSRNIDSIDDCRYLEKIDYCLADKELQVFKQKSAAFLQRALNEPF